MNPMRQRSPRQLASDQTNYELERSRSMRAAQEQADKLRSIASGVPESKLLSTAKQMDVGAAARSADFLKGGRGNASMALNRATANVPSIMSNLNVNRPSAQVAGAVAASPVSMTPAPSRFVAPTPLSGPGGNRATDAAELAANLAQTQPGGLAAARQPAVAPAQRAGNALARATSTVPPVATAPGIGRTLAADGGAYKGALDAVAANPNLGANGYGTGSVRMAKAGEVASPLVAGSMDPNGTGPQRASTAFDPEVARAALFAKHPAIFQAGTDENAQFDAHAKQYGLESAHQNADSIVASVNASRNATAAKDEANRPVSPTNPSDANTAAVNAALNTPPVAPPQSVAAQAGQRAGSAISSIVGRAGRAIDRGIVAPVANTVAAGVDAVKGLFSPSQPITPTARYTPSPEPTPYTVSQPLSPNPGDASPPMVAEKKKKTWDNL